MKRGLARLIAVCLLSAACTSSNEAPPERSDPSQATPRSGEIHFGVLGAPASMDPYSPLASDLTFALTRPLYPSLFSVLPDGSVEPELAADMVATPDGVRVSLEEAEWSSGAPITARDVVATWRRAHLPSGLALASQARTDGGSVVFEGKVEDWAVALATRSPILPAGRASASRFGGPFVLADRTPGLELVYEPNENWFGGDVRPDRVVVQNIDSLDTMLALLDEGRLDAAAPPSTVNLGQRLDVLGLAWDRELGWESLRLDARGGAGSATGLFAAIDRPPLAEGLIRSDGRIADTPWPTPDDGGADGRWDVPEARMTSSASLAVPHGDELLGLLQRALQRQLLRAGVSLDLIDIDPATFYGSWRQAHPATVSLMRVAGGPLGSEGEPDLDPSEVQPLFQVHTYLTWREGVEGLVVNPTFEGPLWNAHEWSNDEDGDA